MKCLINSTKKNWKHQTNLENEHQFWPHSFGFASHSPHQKTHFIPHATPNT
jgi:hypothetical protein